MALGKICLRKLILLLMPDLCVDVFIGRGATWRFGYIESELVELRL